MKLGEKIRYLREVEGSLRGLARPMTYYFLVACGIVLVTLLAGLYLRRGAPEVP